MTDLNNFNFENIGQEQNTGYGTTQLDPSTFLQGDNAVLSATAGFGETSNDAQIISQNDNLQYNNFDTNAIFGETLKTETQIPESFGQTFQTTNNIEGNNYFGDTNTFISNQNQENNIDINNYITNATNSDNNITYGQTQVLPATTSSTPTTEINNYYDQTQGIQIPTTSNNFIYGESQVLPETQTQNQIDYGQIPTQTTETQNLYTTYQTSGTENINNYTTEIQAGTTQGQTFYTPITQTETQTTTQQVFQQTDLQPIQNVQAIGQLDFEAYPSSNANNVQTNIENISPQQGYDITQYQKTQDINTITSPLQNITTTTDTQIISSPPDPKIIQTSQPIVTSGLQPIETNITPSPITENAQTTQNNIILNTPAPVAQQPVISQNQNLGNVEINQDNIIKEINKLPGYKNINKLIDDEDFRRGRPIYNDIANPSTKLKYQNNQVGRTYKVRDILGFNSINLGLSRLTPAMSYNLANLNPSQIGLYNNIKDKPIMINDNLRRVLNSNINNVNNSINNLNTNIGNNINNAVGNVNNNLNSGLDKLTKASSYNVGAQSITPNLNNAIFNSFKGDLENK